MRWKHCFPDTFVDFFSSPLASLCLSHSSVGSLVIFCIPSWVISVHLSSSIWIPSLAVPRLLLSLLKASLVNVLHIFVVFIGICIIISKFNHLSYILSIFSFRAFNIIIVVILNSLSGTSNMSVIFEFGFNDCSVSYECAVFSCLYAF